MKITKIEQPVAVFGIWRVYADGTLKATYKNPSGRESQIHIYPERLQEPDFVNTIRIELPGIDWNDLIPALFTAWRLAGIKSIENFQTDLD
jgi:hypothetical protein